MAKGKAKQSIQNGQQPTDALEWRKSREVGELVPLPSGNWARLRPVDLMKMIKQGTIPDLLSPIAAKTVWVEENTEEIGNSLDMATQYYDLVEIVVPCIFVSPEIVGSADELDDNKILLDDVDQTDRVAAFNLAIAGVSAMRSFREQQAKFMASLSNGNENGDATE